MAALIRPAGQHDTAAIAGIYAPSVISAATSFETEPPDAREMGRRLAHTMPRHPWLVCEAADSSTTPGTGRVLGYAYASKHQERAAYRWSVNVSVYVDARARRCGVGRGLYTSLLAILTAQGYVNAYAGITLPNPGSVGLHEAVGFEPLVIYRNVGYKFGAWHDVGWWERTLAVHAAAPAEPVDVPTLAHSAHWPSLLDAGLRCIRLDAAC